MVLRHAAPDGVVVPKRLNVGDGRCADLVRGVGTGPARRRCCSAHGPAVPSGFFPSGPRLCRCGIPAKRCAAGRANTAFAQGWPKVQYDGSTPGGVSPAAGDQHPATRGPANPWRHALQQLWGPFRIRAALRRPHAESTDEFEWPGPTSAAQPARPMPWQGPHLFSFPGDRSLDHETCGSVEGPRTGSGREAASRFTRAWGTCFGAFRSERRNGIRLPTGGRRDPACVRPTIASGSRTRAN